LTPCGAFLALQFGVDPNLSAIAGRFGPTYNAETPAAASAHRGRME
jgi:hypothetical protein